MRDLTNGTRGYNGNPTADEAVEFVGSYDEPREDVDARAAEAQRDEEGAARYALYAAARQLIERCGYGTAKMVLAEANCDLVSERTARLTRGRDDASVVSAFVGGLA